MRVNSSIVNEESKLFLRYENNEWERLREKFESMGLKTAKTEMGFGRGIKTEFYKSARGKLLEFLIDNGSVKDKVGEVPVFLFESSYLIFDDINSSAIVGRGYCNIAPLRVIPDENNSVEIGLSKYMKSAEVMNYATLLAKVYRALDEISDPVEINIKIKEKEEKKDNEETQTVRGRRHYIGLDE
jgi:hypothetical protein